MQVVGTIMEVGIGVQCPKNGGGSYPGTRITYRDKDGSLKEQMLHENATKYNAELKDAIASLKQGDTFTMIKEKEGAHWNVKSIINGVVSAPPQSAPAAVSGGATSASGNSSPKSTYQTAEERAQVQVYIVRQSTLTQAINYLQLSKDFDATPANVIEIAKQFESHVFGNEYDDGSIEHIKSDIL